MKLILVRHGECDKLVEGIYNGWENYPLTTNGITQAKELGKMLASEKLEINKVYTSVLDRTKDTAHNILFELDTYNVIKMNDVEVTHTYLLNERHYGIFQGKSRTALKNNQEYEHIYKRWAHEDTRPPQISDLEHKNLIEKYTDILKNEHKGISDSDLLKVIPKSESLRDISLRIDKFFDLYLYKYISKNIDINPTILLVSHSNVLKLIVKKIEQISDYPTAMKNLFATCGCYIYDIDNNSILEKDFKVESKLILNNKWYA